MTNDEVYAAGLLIRALDAATQPREIREFLSAELQLLSEIVGPGTRMIDIGCGTGRHLAFLAERLRLGVGVDYPVRPRGTGGNGRLPADPRFCAIGTLVLAAMARLAR